MRGKVFLRFVLLGSILAGCGDDPVPSFTPEDASDEAAPKDATDDIGPPPDFDVPQFDNPTPPDLTSPPDTTPPPPDRSMPPADTTPPPPDRSVAPDAVSPGMCPSSCRADGDCNPCATPGDPGNYCCISGLCLYMTGACKAPAPDGGTTSPDGGDGGGGAPGDGGGDGGGG
jgi:hypothetical protein